MNESDVAELVAALTLIWRFVVGVFATYLIVLYLVYDDGPPLPVVGPLFLWIRRLAGFQAGIYLDDEWTPVSELEDEEDLLHHMGIRPEDYVYRSDGSWTAQLLSCHRCTGFWVGLIVGLSLFGLSLFGLQAAFAVAGGAVYLHEKD